MKDYFIKLYQYDLWASQALISIIEQEQLYKGKDDYIPKVFSHLVNAQYIWMERIQTAKLFNIPVWEVHAFDELKKLLEEASQNWLSFLQDSENSDFQKTISYQSTEGVAYQSTLQDITAHVANHGTYHRGQINRAIREAGFTPASIDYIFYAR